MCGETIRPTIWQSPFLYSKLYNIYSIFNIYFIGIGENCIVWLILIIIIIIIIILIVILIVINSYMIINDDENNAQSKDN